MTHAAAGPRVAQLSEAARAQLAHGIRQFNDRLFFECHDTLEEMWSALRGDERDFVQGLIQIAVAFYHLGNGNTPGAVRLFDRGLERLRAYPEQYAGLDTGPLRSAAVRWREAAASGDGLPAEAPPTIALAPADEEIRDSQPR